MRQRYKYNKEGIIPGVTNMALQIRRGTDAERQLFIPLQGEIIFTTDTKKLYVGDGTTAGGIAVDTLGGGGATYGISAEVVSGGANLRLTGSDSSIDNVKLAAGSNVTISRTDADTITIAATGDGGAVQLNELTDVVITGTPSTGQVLKYDGTNWVNGTDNVGGGGGGATVLDELNDVVITGTPALDQVLIYDGTDWVNGAIPASPLDDLSNVNIDTLSLAAGQSLIYDGTEWINDISTVSLDSLSDVIITDQEVAPGIFSLLEGMTLVYDGTDWVNQFAALDNLSDVVIDALSLSAGQTLRYNGVNWTHDDLALDSLSDVNYGTLNTDDILYWDGTDWTNQPFAISIDQTPSLGGNLDLSNFDITGTGNIDIVGNIQATEFTITSVLSPIGVSVASEDNIPLSLQGLTGINNPAIISLQAYKGSLATPVNTAPSEVLGGYTVSGYYDGDYKLAGAILANWSPGSDLATGAPRSSLWFVLGNNTNPTSIVPTASLSGAGMFTTKVFRATPQTTVEADAVTTLVAGMIVFDSTLQKFKGYVSDTGLAGGGAPNSTPGWVNLN